MMITLANQNNNDDAKSGITQFKETALEIGIDRIVEGTITTYQTLFLKVHIAKNKTTQKDASISVLKKRAVRY